MGAGAGVRAIGGIRWVAFASILIGCGRTEHGNDPTHGSGSSGGATQEALTSTSSAGTAGIAETGGAPGTVDSTTAASAGGAGGSGVSSAGGTSSVGGTSGAGGDGDCPEGICDDTWEQPKLLETDDTLNVLGARVAMNDDGTAVVAWAQIAGTLDGEERSRTWATPYTLEAGWGTSQLLWAETTYVNQPNVALANDGAVMVLWDTFGAAPELESSYYPSGAEPGWLAAGALPVSSNSWGVQPDLAMDANGTAVVVWVKSGSEPFDTWDDEIWSNLYRPDSGWGTATPVQLEVGAALPAVDMNASGDAVAVWLQTSGDATGPNEFWSSQLDDSHPWTTPQRIQVVIDGSGHEPQVTLDASGHATAVWWQDLVDGGSHVWTSRFTPEAGWSNVEVLDRAVTAAYYPRIGVDGDGNVVAVWLQKDGAEDQIWSSRRALDAGWDAPEQLSDAGFGCSRPEIAVGSAGDAIAVWTQAEVDGSSLWANRYVTGAGWRGSERVDVGPPGISEDADVAIDGKGNAIVVWNRTDDYRWNLWGSNSSRP